jgi:DNA-binding NarL/FixJ family response regulator
MRTVLVVEDEITTWLALEYQLRCSNLDALLDRAATYEEAAERWLVQQHRLDLAIIDLQLPVENIINPDRGFDFIAEMQERYPHVPIIILTGRNDLPAFERAKSYPKVRYFVIKPWSQAELVETVRTCIQGYPGKGKPGELVIIGKLEQ